MREVAIVEFWIIAVLIVVGVVVFGLLEKEHKLNSKLKLDCIKAKNEADYAKKLMELKDEAYRNVKEKNEKLNEGSMSDRVAAAGNILCNG